MASTAPCEGDQRGDRAQVIRRRHHAYCAATFAGRVPLDRLRTLGTVRHRPFGRRAGPATSLQPLDAPRPRAGHLRCAGGGRRLVVVQLTVTRYLRARGRNAHLQPAAHRGAVRDRGERCRRRDPAQRRRQAAGAHRDRGLAGLEGARPARRAPRAHDQRRPAHGWFDVDHRRVRRRRHAAQGEVDGHGSGADRRQVHALGTHGAAELVAPRWHRHHGRRRRCILARLRASADRHARRHRSGGQRDTPASGHAGALSRGDERSRDLVGVGGSCHQRTGRVAHQEGQHRHRRARLEGRARSRRLRLDRAPRRGDRRREGGLRARRRRGRVARAGGESRRADRRVPRPDAGRSGVGEGRQRLGDPDARWPTVPGLRGRVRELCQRRSASLQPRHRRRGIEVGDRRDHVGLHAPAGRVARRHGGAWPWREAVERLHRGVPCGRPPAVARAQA